MALVLLGARTILVCDSDPGCLVLAGDRFTDPAAVPIPVEEGSGYDGQFFYRQARSPLDFTMESSNGVRFDTEARAGRVGYPAAVWVLSAGGQPSAVPIAMLAVNAASFGAIAYVLASAARRAGRSPWLGLAATAIPGAVFAAGRSLADPFSAAVVGAASYLLLTRRWGWAAAMLCVGVLTKEQTVIVPVAYGVQRVWTIARGRRPALDVSDLPWILPGLVFVAWQGALWSVLGDPPFLDSSGNHVAFPATDLVPAVVDWLTPSGFAQVLWIVEVVSLVVLAVLVLVARSPELWQRLVAALSLLLLAVLNEKVTIDPAHYRQFADLTVVMLMASFAVRSRVRAVPIALNLGATAGVALLMLQG